MEFKDKPAVHQFSELLFPEKPTVRNSQKLRKVIAKAAGLCTLFKMTKLLLFHFVHSEHLKVKSTVHDSEKPIFGCFGGN